MHNYLLYRIVSKDKMNNPNDGLFILAKNLEELESIIIKDNINFYRGEVIEIITYDVALPYEFENKN